MKHHVILLLCLIFLLGYGNGYGQTPDLKSDIATQNYSSDWKIFSEDENIVISYLYSDCSDETNGIFIENILLKITNKTKSTVFVSWDYLVLLSDGSIINSDGEDVENSVRISVLANSSVKAVCGASGENNLSVFVRMKDQPDAAVLSELNLVNLKTTKLD